MARYHDTIVQLCFEGKHWQYHIPSGIHLLILFVQLPIGRGERFVDRRPERYKKHLKLEGKAELLTFALAISSRHCCSNYLLFNKLFLTVVPFSNSSGEIGLSTLSGTRLNTLLPLRQCLSMDISEVWQTDWFKF